jgi:hypothetical protein
LALLILRLAILRLAAIILLATVALLRLLSILRLLSVATLPLVVVLLAVLLALRRVSSTLVVTVARHVCDRKCGCGCVGRLKIG